MKWICIYFISIIVISAAVPQDLCDTCVPTHNCPLFEKLNVTEQLKWMETFPCGYLSKTDNFEVPTGFAAAAKGDYVCCSNNVWGIEKIEYFEPRIGHESGTDSPTHSPSHSDNYSFSNSNNPSNGPENNNNNDQNNSKNSMMNEELNNYYYNKYTRTKPPENYKSLRNNNSNIKFLNRNVDDYNSNTGGGTVWFPDRGQNYDNTDYWQTHNPENNNNNPAINAVIPPNKYDPPENIGGLPNQLNLPENEARPPNEYDPPGNEATLPVQNEYPANIVKLPIQYDAPGNMDRLPIQNMPPGYDVARPPNYYGPGDTIREPNQYHPLGNFKPPQYYGPEDTVRPPNQYYPPGNSIPPQYYGPEETVRPPNQYYPPGNSKPPQYYGPEDTVRPPNQYYPPGNSKPPQYSGPEDTVRPPNQYYPPGNSKPPQYYGPDDTVRPPNQYYPPGTLEPPQYYDPEDTARQPNQYYPPGRLEPPNQYIPPGNMERPSTYFPLENMPGYTDSPWEPNYNNYEHRNRRNDNMNYDYNLNNPSYSGYPYNLYNRDNERGSSGGQCRLTSFPPDPQGECCGRQLADDDRIAGWNNKPSYTNQWATSPPRSGPIWRSKREISENDTDVTIENRISGGHATELYQYPWTVLLLTTFDYGRREASFNCGGGLISAKYVLTAGHCVYDKDAVIKSVQVNLAEYDKNTFPKDCKATRTGRRCIENIVMYAEEVVTHPQYDNENLVNDIALLRLRGTAPYTEYIRPICLPTINIDEPQFANLQFEVSGWGRVGPYSSNIKQSTFLNLVNHNECKRSYPQLTNKHLCAAGKRGEDTCKGDSGGPLMFLFRGRYYVSGIVSGKRADSPCGTSVPSLYTNVYHYVNWIRSNIRN